MVDWTRPLKLENPADGGDEFDSYPTEMDPSDDGIDLNGIRFESSSLILTKDGSDNLDVTNGAVFNSNSGDYNFTIKKNTSGNAFKRDSGLNTSTFYGSLTIEGDVYSGNYSTLYIQPNTSGVLAGAYLVVQNQAGTNKLVMGYEESTNDCYFNTSAAGGLYFINNNVEFNNGATDSDFTIKKLTSGTAYVYDAGLDTHTFSGDFTAEDKVTLASNGLGTVGSPNLLLGSGGIAPQIGLYESPGAGANTLGVSIAGNDVIKFKYNSAAIGEPTSVQLASGSAVSEFSIDGTMADNSDTAIPTEQAVKTYVDNAVSAEDFWDRTGTTIKQKTVDDKLELDMTTQVTPALTLNNTSGLSQHITTIAWQDNGATTFDIYYAKITGGNWWEIYNNVNGNSSLKILEADDSVEMYGGLTVNSGAGDNDFTIKKNTSGDSYVYDAGNDLITTNSQFDFTDGNALGVTHTTSPFGFGGNGALGLISVDDAGISGIGMQNQNSGTGADFRFAIWDNTGGPYIALAMPSSGNTSSLFNVQRKESAFLFTNSTRDLTIGTVSNRTVRIGTNNNKRIEIAGTGGDVEIFSTTTSGGSTTGSLVTAGGVGIGDNLNVSAGAEFNRSASDSDFIINKLTSGQALTYDAGTDEFDIDSRVYISSNGTAANPILAIGSSNAGFWRSATQGLKIGVSGTEMMTFRNSAAYVEFHKRAVSTLQDPDGSFTSNMAITGSSTDNRYGFVNNSDISSFSADITGTVGVAGFKNDFNIGGGALGLKTITGAAGFYDLPDFSGASPKAITNYYGAYFADATAKTTAIVNNHYGVYIEGPTQGDTSNKAIYVGGGDIELNTDNFDIIGVADGATLSNHPTGGVPLAIATVDYVDSAVSAEDFWDRTGTTLSPQNSGDSISIDNAATFNANFLYGSTFTINKFNVGTAYVYTASTDVHAWDGTVIFNNSFSDKDFTINNNTSGTAYVYDAGLDTHSFSGDMFSSSKFTFDNNRPIYYKDTAANESLAISVNTSDVLTIGPYSGSLIDQLDIRLGQSDVEMRFSSTNYLFNVGNNNRDFTINKNTSGTAYVYDAGVDTHTFNSDVTVNQTGTSGIALETASGNALMEIKSPGRTWRHGVGSGGNYYIYDADASAVHFRINAGSLATGYTNVLSTKDSSSSGTGALVVSGGVGIAKNVYVGGNSVFNANNGDYDFSINKNTSGTALVYDAGNDNFTYDSPIILDAGTTTTCPIKFQTGSLLTTPAAGCMEYDGDRFYLTEHEERRVISLSSDAKVSDTTVANTTVETTLYSVVVQSEEAAVGKVYRIPYFGVFSTANASDTLTLRLKVDGSALTINVNPKVVSNKAFHGDLMFIIRTTGASGTFAALGHCDADDSSYDNATTGSIDTTTDITLSITAQWDNALAGNTATLYGALLEDMN